MNMLTIYPPFLMRLLLEHIFLIFLDWILSNKKLRLL